MIKKHNPIILIKIVIYTFFLLIFLFFFIIRPIFNPTVQLNNTIAVFERFSNLKNVANTNNSTMLLNINKMTFSFRFIFDNLKNILKITKSLIDPML